MMSSCLGGERETSGASRLVDERSSRGPRRGGFWAENLVDPRMPPDLPSLVRMDSDGRSKTDKGGEAVLLRKPRDWI